MGSRQPVPPCTCGGQKAGIPFSRQTWWQAPSTCWVILLAPFLCFFFLIYLFILRQFPYIDLSMPGLELIAILPQVARFWYHRIDDPAASVYCLLGFLGSPLDPAHIFMLLSFFFFYHRLCVASRFLASCLWNRCFLGCGLLAWSCSLLGWDVSCSSCCCCCHNGSLSNSCSFCEPLSE